MNASSKSGGPVLDEATFQKLLAAAYVLQEHHDRSQNTPATESGNPNTDSDTSILAQIVETQHEIQAKHLDLDGTTNLVMDRILKITGAQGASIGVLDGDQFVYKAARGILAGQVGKSVRLEAALSASTLLHDMILRCPEAATDFRVNPELTKRLGIGSLISVPVLHNGKTGGSLELAFTKANAFHDQDVRTCQLMAGLVTETLTRTSEEQWRKGLAAERASMLEVLEKIKPQLARLANAPDAALTLGHEQADLTTADTNCQKCGNELSPGEVFCGACGTSRASSPHNDLQSKWATLWNLKKAAEEAQAVSSADPVTNLLQQGSPVESTGDLTPQLSSVSETALLAAPARESAELSVASEVQQTAITRQEESVLAERKPPEGRVWLRSIAVSPPAVQLKAFLQKSAPFVRKHRGDLALGASFVLFLITILWAVSSDHPTTSADSGNAASPAAAVQAKPKRKQVPPQPKLGFFDQMLVDLGIAEPPPAPSYNGNPNIPVWVDVHTALYYCPGSDLYGKTPQGKIASQHDAQLDQFEPASRKVCD